jgi:hypothetical protein
MIIVQSKYCICCAVLCMYFLVVVKLRIYKDPGTRVRGGDAGLELIFLVQKLYLYRDAKDPALEDEDETLGSSS